MEQLYKTLCESVFTCWFSSQGKLRYDQGFIRKLMPGLSLGRLHMERFVPPYGGGQVQGDKALIGGTDEGDIDLIEGDLTLTDYIIN